MDISNETYVKTSSSDVFEDFDDADVPATENAKKASKSHPSYYQMARDTIGKLSGRSAVSRAKIASYLKETYEINVSNQHLSKALNTLREEKVIENISGVGANGSYKLTKEFKEQQKAITKALSKKTSTSKLSSTSASSGKDKSKKGEKSTKSSAVEETTKKKKEDKPSEKKKPIAKGKENKDVVKDGSRDAKSTKSSKPPAKEMKILKEKINKVTGNQEKASNSNETTEEEESEDKPVAVKKRGRKAVSSSKLK